MLLLRVLFLLLLSLISSSATEGALLRSSSKVVTSGRVVPTSITAAEIDMLLQRRPHGSLTQADFVGQEALYDDRVSRHGKSGRAEVEAAIKTFQRFTLQLDRSDGRPDITLVKLAEKYDDFVSTCLRTEGAAWTAAIGPLDYLGVKLPAYRQRESHLYTIDVPALCVAVGTKLLDLPTSPAERNKIVDASDTNRNAVWSLGLVVARLATRFALFEDVLQGNAMQHSDPLLVLRYLADDDSDRGVPPAAVIESILSLDLGISDYSVDQGSNTFITSRSAMGTWIQKNNL